MHAQAFCNCCSCSAHAGDAGSSRNRTSLNLCDMVQKVHMRAAPPCMSCACRASHLHALSVDSVASIFSIGGHWPYSSTCSTASDPIRHLTVAEFSACYALASAPLLCCCWHQLVVTLSSSAAFTPLVSSSFFKASLMVVALAIMVQSGPFLSWLIRSGPFLLNCCCLAQVGGKSLIHAFDESARCRDAVILF